LGCKALFFFSSPFSGLVPFSSFAKISKTSPHFYGQLIAFSPPPLFYSFYRYQLSITHPPLYDPLPLKKNVPPASQVPDGDESPPFFFPGIPPHLPLHLLRIFGHGQFPPPPFSREGKSPQRRRPSPFFFFESESLFSPACHQSRRTLPSSLLFFSPERMTP